MTGFPFRQRTEGERHLLARRIGQVAYRLPQETAQPLKAVRWLEQREARLVGQIDRLRPVDKSND